MLPIIIPDVNKPKPEVPSKQKERERKKKTALHTGLLTARHLVLS
jgi:hypothetical protein